MGFTSDCNGVYAPSSEVVAREIEGELILVPLCAGIGEADDDLFTLNETGKATWARLDGRRPLRDVIRSLAEEYEAPEDVIQSDVLGLLDELLKRKMVVAVGAA